ncbi:hypothetical protein BDBG_04281 [Blastomyces gilchristii SLH14081]|uniref:Uncharacterized protein n=1 Tax=Blastomyces gilchristii (strain SLH14081) TaxID=559298 RepID=A0A179UMS4_BLAGS|nr:uncharacterized protein BDBG_04281 [Blastomyces gilchristii SLH14081]OAT08321.1 hypothetical protein BDBG_04281 [Blastomyces gilchristii SLH14081]
MDISTVVTSILAAFGNGRDLFNRVQQKKDLKRTGTDKSKRNLRTHGSRKKKRRNTNDAAVPVRSEDIDDLRIQASLERGPAEIKREYDQSVQRLGERFKKGDELAHGSLAHTLLILNAGLMKLIASCLSSDGQGYNCAGTVDRRSLLSLSDSAAADAITALDELRQRLISASTPAPKSAMIPAGQKERQRSRSLSRQRSGKSSKAEDKCRPQSAARRPTTTTTQVKKNVAGSPLKPASNIASSNQAFRGMWIRSRKGSSISLATTAVTSQHPAQQAPKKLPNMIKQCDMEHNQGHPAFAHLQQHRRSPNNEGDFQFSGRDHRGQQLPSSIRTTVISTDNRRTAAAAAPSISRVLRKDMPPLSPLVPLSQNLQPPRGRAGAGGCPAVASSTSVSSGSTKLGEIPNRGRFSHSTSLQPTSSQARNSGPTGPVVEVGYQRPSVAFHAGLEYWRRLAAEANEREGVNARRGVGGKKVGGAFF